MAAAAGQWYFKSDLRFKDDDPTGWQRYSADENEILEDAYKRGSSTATLSRKYRVNMDRMFQYRVDDESKQRPVKREAVADRKKRGREAELVGEHVFVVCMASDRSDDAEIVGVYSTRDAAIAKRRRKQDKLAARHLPWRVFMTEVAIKP